MPEYKVIVNADAKVLQTWLNQWRHEFAIKLHGMQVNTIGEVSVIVERSPNAK